MNIAHQIVDNLLEGDIERACMQCCKEHNYQKPGLSHGWCRRHYIKYLYDNAENLDFDQALADAEKMPDSSFSPDMGPVQ